MRRQIIAAASAALVGGFLATAGPSGPASADLPDPAGQYVAFGDSFVSGPGIAPQRDNACEQSEKNFPSLVATKFAITDFIDASCAGAKTTDLFESQPTRNPPPQLDALTANTKLITFGTLGGNDMGLVNLALGCIGDAECPTEEQDTKANEGIETARTNMLEGIADAKVRSPEAEIYVIGYGTYLKPGGCAVLQGLGMTGAESDYVQSKIDQLSDMLSDVADQPGVHFVDMRTIPGVEDHTACAEPEAQWIRALQTYEDGAMLHPSACGHVAMAQQVIRTIQADNGEPVDAFDDSCVSAGPDDPTPPDDTEERLAALKAAAKTTKISTNCTSKKRASGKLIVRVKGGKGMVAKVVFKVGTKKIGTDKTAPYQVKTKAKPLSKVSGKVSAKVTLRDADLSVERTLKHKRPHCLKR